MDKKMLLMVIGAFLMFFVGITSSQAATNIALTGTAGNDGYAESWGDTTSNLNDRGFVFGSADMLMLNNVEPHRAYITWNDEVVVDQVKVYHLDINGTAPYYITKEFQIQTLVEGGNSTNDADWVTQDSVANNTNLVTTHSFPPVVTRGVRIFITKSNSANSTNSDGYGRILEMEVYGPSLANVGLVGTPANDGLDYEWDKSAGYTMTDNLIDGVLGVPGWVVFDSGFPARGWITWKDAVLVQEVKVYNAVYADPAAHLTYSTAYQIQTLVDGGNPANDADWVTHASIENNTDTDVVTTHAIPSVLTRGVRILITGGPYPIVEELEVWGYMSEPLYVFSLQAKLEDLKAELVTANANIASLQNQLAIAQADLGTANATILSLQSQLNTAIALAGSLQAQLDAANAMIASLTAQLNTANATIASQQATITTLQNSLNAAYDTIGLLNAEVSRLTAEYDAAIAGLAEIKRLIGTPQGKRASNGIEAGDTTVGALVNDVIDMLLAPPGQNIRNQDWK